MLAHRRWKIQVLHEALLYTQVQLYRLQDSALEWSEGSHIQAEADRQALRKEYREKARKSIKEDKEARVLHKRMEDRIEIRRAEIAMKMVEAAGEADMDNFGNKPIHDEGHRLAIAEVAPCTQLF